MKKHKINKQGELYLIQLGNTNIMPMFTHAGEYRGGHSYSQKKYYTLTEGRGAITKHIEGEDIVTELELNTLYSVDSHIPHLLHFTESSVYIEWWIGDETKEPFEPYQVIKNSGK